MDIDTGVADDDTAPDLRVVRLFGGRREGAAREGYPLMRAPTAVVINAAAHHIYIHRRGSHSDATDEGEYSARVERRIATIFVGFSIALALARVPDLDATVLERHTIRLCEGMHVFPLPFHVTGFTVSMSCIRD